MSTSVYTPDGMIANIAVGVVPSSISAGLDAVGVNVDREDPGCQWATTVECRLLAAVDIEFAIIDPNGFFDDPATAHYILIPADTTYPIPLRDAHEKIYIKAAAPATVTVELYGSRTPAAPM